MQPFKQLRRPAAAAAARSKKHKQASRTIVNEQQLTFSYYYLVAITNEVLAAAWSFVLGGDTAPAKRAESLLETSGGEVNRHN